MMTTEKGFETWIVERGSLDPHEPLWLSGDLPEVFMSAGRLLANMGASIIEAQNLDRFMGQRGLLIQDPTFPFAVVVKGAYLSDESSRPLSQEEGRTELFPLCAAIDE